MSSQRSNLCKMTKGTLCYQTVNVKSNFYYVSLDKKFYVCKPNISFYDGVFLTKKFTRKKSDYF